MAYRLLAGALLAVQLCGCAGDREVNCEDSDRYARAQSVPPVRVPDDLSVPDESNSLQLPPSGDGVGSATVAGPCLESPPDFFEDSALGDPEAGQGPGRSAPPAAEPEPSPEREIGN